MTPLDEPFDSWVSPHVSILLALAVREVGPDAAQDVVQEALLRAWRRLETFDASRSARAWLVAIMLDQARRYRIRKLRPLPAPPKPGPSALAVDERLQVESAVRSLPRRQRETIILHYLVDLPVADIAQALHISVSAVKSHLRDGRNALHKLLEQHDQH